jgi:hypothetical protein
MPQQFPRGELLCGRIVLRPPKHEEEAAATPADAVTPLMLSLDSAFRPTNHLNPHSPDETSFRFDFWADSAIIINKLCWI